MKTRIFAAAMLWAAPVWGQTDIHYNIQETVTPIISINSRGAMIVEGSRGSVVTDDQLIVNGKKITDLVCPGSNVSGLDNTIPFKVNDKLDVVGYCFQPGIGDIGFVMHRDRSYTFIHVPNATATYAFGINGVGQVVGQWWSHLDNRYRGFLWDKLSYQTIDFPVPGSQTVLLGISNDGTIVGAYFTYDPVNNGASEWHGFIWSNGNFFPLSYPGTGNWTYLLDITNDGVILGRFDLGPEGLDGGPSEPSTGSGGHFLEDDGKFYRVVFPTVQEAGNNHVVWDVNGSNNQGQLAGSYNWSECRPTSEGPNCKFFRKGFIATPKPVQKGR